MNEEKLLRKLASAARGDQPPPIDVAEWVMDDLARARRPGNALLWVFTAASSAAAAIIITAALLVWEARQDPVGEFMQSTMAMIQ